MFFFFFFNDTATTEIYTLSLHDALPISATGTTLATRTNRPLPGEIDVVLRDLSGRLPDHRDRDRKSTRLNSSHANISYAVFCLKKKKTNCNVCAHYSVASR